MIDEFKQVLEAHGFKFLNSERDAFDPLDPGGEVAEMFYFTRELGRARQLVHVKIRGANAYWMMIEARKTEGNFDSEDSEVAFLKHMHGAPTHQVRMRANGQDALSLKKTLEASNLQ